MDKIFIIAEAGDNHNGSLELALKLVDKAAEAGADCVKFQTFVTEEIICHDAKMAEYQMKNTGVEESQFDMVKRLELSFDEFKEIYRYCQKKNIMFLSTPFDRKSIAFLDSLDIPFWKIPSGEVTNYPYLVDIAKTKRPVVMSTGMCTKEDIKEAIAVLRANGSEDITLLHCNTEYPTPMCDVNLRAMFDLKEEFGVKVGYSDHTLGTEVPIAAAAMGAVILEKHFTLDCNMPGPDHKASLEPEDLKRMVRAVRNIEQAMGDGEKRPSESEQKNIVIARKSIVAAERIVKGEYLTEDKLAVKRPGDGMSPMLWNKLIGKKASRDYEADEQIWEEL